MASIFINYRRDDSAGHAGRLYDRLSDHFGPDQVFMDIDTIKPGRDFVEAVSQAVSGCDGFVAIIGREWLKISDATGARRLEDPEDLVRLEIATALELGIRVVPVLVQGARMPSATDLPESIKELARRNAQEISDRSFNSDVQRLIDALEALLPNSPDAPLPILPEAPLLDSPEKDGFVGREREMAEVRTALNGAMAGNGRLVMLSGEPGIGKTRMTQELALHAQGMGFQVLWGWCYEQEGAPPYWPWVDSVRSYVNLTDSAELISQMGPGAADISEVIPELKEKIPDLKPPPSLDPDQARFRLFDSLSTFFTNAAKAQPIMLVLDDLHWADKPSLLLLEFLTRRLAGSRLLVIGTYRDAEVKQGDPLYESLGQLRRSQAFQSTLLGGLESAHVADFIRSEGGGAASQELIDAIYAHTEGNPFFMSEVIRLLVGKGELEERSGTSGPVTLDIPRGVLEVIEQRLNRLSDRCVGVLTTVSVAGRQFDFKLLEALNEQATAIELLELVDEALEARVIDESAGHRDRYQFSHALMQKTMLERLSTSRKVMLHASMGEALESLYGDGAETHAAELSRHFNEAKPVLGREKAVRYSLLAGEQALTTYAYEDALSTFERALESKDGRPIDLDDAALLFGLGRSQASMNQRGAAVDSLTRCFDYYVDIGDIPSAIAVAEYPVAPGLGRVRVSGLLAKALELVSPGSDEAGYLQSRYGLALGMELADSDNAQKAFQAALTIARQGGNLELEVKTLADSAQTDFFNLRWHEMLENSLKTIELARLCHDPLAEMSACFYASIPQLNLGELESARSRAKEGLALADQIRHRGWLVSLLWTSEIASFLGGDWESSRKFSDRSLAIARSDPRLLSTRIKLEYEIGEFEQGAVYLNRLLEAMGHSSPGANLEYVATAQVLPHVINITGAFDRAEVAEMAANAVMSSSYATPLFAQIATYGLSLLAVIRGDVSSAQEHYETLEAADRNIFPSLISPDRLLGLLAQTSGDLKQAICHMQDSLEFCQKSRFRPEEAWTSHDLAVALQQRNEPGDQQRALSLVDEALVISSELGMRPLMERLYALRE